VILIDISSPVYVVNKRSTQLNLGTSVSGKKLKALPM